MHGYWDGEEHSQTGFRFAGNRPESEQEPADDKEFGLRVEIDDKVYKKVMHWIDKAPGEVSGLGKVVHDAQTNIIRVVDAILLPQKNTGSTTEIEASDVAKAMFLTKDSPGTLRWWWHSHVNMNVFWSGTDVATIKQLGGGGWFLSTVLNKKREMKSAYCQVAPVRMIVDDLSTHVMEVLDSNLIEKWNQEYEKNCTVVVPSYVNHYGNNNSYLDKRNNNTILDVIRNRQKEQDEDKFRPWYLKDSSEMNDEEKEMMKQVSGPKKTFPSPEQADNFPRETDPDNDEEDDVIQYFKTQGYIFDDDGTPLDIEDDKMDLVKRSGR